jgi:hypothetical protein
MTGTMNGASQRVIIRVTAAGNHKKQFIGLCKRFTCFIFMNKANESLV